MEETTNEFEELLHNQEDEAFIGFMVLKAIYLSKKKKEIRKEEIYFIYKNYARLLAERKKMLDYKKRLEALNGFMGLG